MLRARRVATRQWNNPGSLPIPKRPVQPGVLLKRWYHRVARSWRDMECDRSADRVGAAGWLADKLHDGTIVMPFAHKDKGYGQRALFSYDNGVRRALPPFLSFTKLSHAHG